MSQIGMGHSNGKRGVVAVPVGRKFAISSPVDCAISISTAAAGDASLGDFHYALLKAGVTINCLIPAASPPVFLSGLTTDPNGDNVQTQLDFVDNGNSNV